MATYSLSKSISAVSEGDVVTFTLTTTGVADNTQVFYIVAGVSSSDINIASVSGYFVVNSNMSVIGFNVTADLLLEGPETLLLTLSNGQASISVNVIDVSKPRRYIFVKDQGTYKESTKIFTKKDNMWFSIQKVYIKVAGIWKLVFAKDIWSFMTSAIGSRTLSTEWKIRAQCTITATFVDAAQARYFFNSGGAIRIYSNRIGGSNTAQNEDWSNILHAAGVRVFNGYWKDGFNFYNLTDTYQIFYQYSSSSSEVYLYNRYLIEVLSNASNNLTGSATQITFRITLDDQHAALGGSPTDYVDGILTITAEEVKAIAPDTEPTIVGPTYILDTIVSE